MVVVVLAVLVRTRAPDQDVTGLWRGGERRDDNSAAIRGDREGGLPGGGGVTGPWRKTSTRGGRVGGAPRAPL